MVHGMVGNRGTAVDASPPNPRFRRFSPRRPHVGGCPYARMMGGLSRFPHPLPLLTEVRDHQKKQ